MEYLIYYLLIINIITFFLFGFDKIRAIKNKRRIPEKYLFILSFFGGIFGSLVAINFFRHKNKKDKFKEIIILIFVIQLLLIAFILWQIIYKNK